MNIEATKRPEVIQILAQAYAHVKAGNIDEAERLCQMVLQAADPEHPTAISLLASCLMKKERYAEAVVLQEKALSLEPGNIEHLKNLELMYRKNKQYELALRTIREVLRLAPEKAAYKQCEGLSLCHLWRLEEAVACFKRVIALDPYHIKAHVMLGNTLQELGQYQEALKHFNTAHYIDPKNPFVIYNRSLLLIKLGDFVQGWKDYEARWQQGKPLVLPDFVKNKPMWDGKDFNGKKLFVLMEQGHGDMIQFSRYLPMVAALGKDLAILCMENMVEMLRPLAPDAEWIAHKSKLPKFDTYVPIMSLPLLFETDLHTIPQRVPYLYASSESLSKWKSCIKEGSRKKVGLCWSGSKKHPKDHIRSIKPELIEQFIAENPAVDFYALEKGESEKKAKEFVQKFPNLLEIGSQLKDFSDSAAIISQMDLVITVDTAPAHLAGALGKPVWNLLQFNADWRWLEGREDSPWYPTMRLFRQKTRDDWQTVLNRVSEELKIYAGKH